MVLLSLLQLVCHQEFINYAFCYYYLDTFKCEFQFGCFQDFFGIQQFF